MPAGNFFAALDDSGDEGGTVKKPVPKKEVKQKATSAPTQPTKKNDDGKRRNPNNDRNTKGGRGSRQARDGKRAYDRRSGTGRGKETKKGGGGARNWGSDKNDAKRAEGAVVEGEEAANTPEGGEIEAAKEEIEEVIEEEPDNTMTFEEYMKSKSGSEIEALKPKSEREVENEFAGKAAKVAVEEDFLVMGGGKQLRKKAGKSKDKQSVNVGFRVAKPSSGGDRERRDNNSRRDGGRGGDRRGRDGKGGNRSGNRGGGSDRRGKSANINVTDTSAFPSL